jgi:6-phosphogluconolactonase (cycloisomerase 2 family)
VSPTSSSPFGDTGENSEWIQFDLTLGQSTFVDLPFELGLGLADESAFSNFGFHIDASDGVRFELGWTFDLGFGISALGDDFSESFYIVAGGNGEDDLPELRATIEVSAAPPKDAFGNDLPFNGPGISAEAALGLILARIEDGVNGEKTSLTLTAGIDLIDPSFSPDNRLTLAELESAALSDVIRPVMSGDAQVRLHVASDADKITGFVEQALGLGAGALELPGVEFDFIVDASVNLVDDGGTLGFHRSLDRLSFDNVVLDVGGLLNKIAVPAANVFEQTLGPVFNVIGGGASAASGFLNKKVPILSDVFPHVTSYKSLLPRTLADGLDDFFVGIEQITTVADSVSNYSGEPISFGNVVYNQEKGKFEFEEALSIPDTSVSLDDFQAEFTPGGFSLDIITTDSMLDMLLGNPFDIVSFNLPDIDVALHQSFGFDFKVLEFSVAGNASLTLEPLGLVYDSTGLANIVNAVRSNAAPDFSDLLDGFYISNAIGPVLTLAVDFSGEGRIGDPDVFGAEGNASLSGKVELGLLDPNGDGELRLDEIVAVTNGFQQPEKLLSLFDIGVTIGGEFLVQGTIAGVKISSKDLGIPTEFGATLELKDVFGSKNANQYVPNADQKPPILATPIVQDGEHVLRLNVGPYANARIYGNTDDSNGAIISVRQITGGVEVSGYGETQPYFGNFSRVLAVGGEGDDELDLSGLKTIQGVLRGNGGNDMLIGGGGDDLIFGGSGNDTIIVTAGGKNQIDTGRGENTVIDGPGDDFIDFSRNDVGVTSVTFVAAGGNDIIIGSRRDDHIELASGNNLVQGGRGNDTLIAGTGNDTLEGGSGNDTLVAGVGNNTLDGGLGSNSFVFRLPNGYVANGDTPFLDGNQVQNDDGGITMFHNVDDVIVDLSNGPGEFRIVSVNLPTTVAGHDRKLVIDRSGAAAPLTGTLDGSKITGLGLADITYTDLNALEVRLGPLADQFTVVDTAPSTRTQIQGGPGDDTITVHRVSGDTVITGNEGDDTAVVVIPAAPSSEPFANLTFNVDEVHIDNSANTEPVDWKLDAAGLVSVGLDTIVDTLGAERVVFIGGSSASDSLTVTNDIARPQRVSVAGNTIETTTGVEVLSFSDFSASDLKASEIVVDGLNNPFVTAASPDGRWVLVGSAGTLAVFSRNLSGSLTSSTFGNLQFESVVDLEALPGVFGTKNITNVFDIQISPNSQFAYVLALQSDGTRYVFGFRIDTITGELSRVTTQSAAVDNPSPGPILFARNMAITPDGKHLLVAGGPGNIGNGYVVGVWDITSTGSLNGNADAGIRRGDLPSEIRSSFDQQAFGIAVSPDGRSVYITNSHNSQHRLVWLGRDLGTGNLGNLTFQAHYTNDHVRTGEIAISPDGQLVVVTSGIANRLTVFVRDTTGNATGRLTQWQSIDMTNPPDGNAVPNPGRMEFTPDGSRLYVQALNFVGVFNRIGSNLFYNRRQTVSDVHIGLSISPDGRNLYTATHTELLVKFRLNPDTGSFLDRIDLQQDLVQVGRFDVTGFDDVALSPGGDHAYAVSSDSNTLGVGVRNEEGDNEEGDFEWGQLIVNGRQGVSGLGGASAVLLSEDEDFVYVAGTDDNSIAVFSRDALTGVLTFVEAFGVTRPTELAESPDGGHLYVVSGINHQIVVLERDTDTGRLSHVQTLSDNQGGVDGLGGASSVVVSSDGQQVYVTGSTDNSVAVFNRNGSTGALTFSMVLRDGENGVTGLLGAASLALSHDGASLYVASPGSNALAVFRRNPEDGTLAYEQTVRQGAAGVRGLSGVGPQALRTRGFHIAIHHGELHRGVAEERILDRGEVRILRVPHHLELDRAILERGDRGPPAGVPAGGHIGFAGLQVQRQVFDVLQLLPTRASHSSAVPVQLRFHPEFDHGLLLNFRASAIASSASFWSAGSSLPRTFSINRTSRMMTDPALTTFRPAPNSPIASRISPPMGPPINAINNALIKISSAATRS